MATRTQTDIEALMELHHNGSCLWDCSRMTSLAKPRLSVCLWLCAA